MANAFDPYREALVVEISTVWPEEFDTWDEAQRAALEDRLHADPRACASMDYVRLHTGFCREVTVTQADLERLGAASAP